MNVRETGIRRIRYVTRGLAVAGVAGSILFAGMAKAATDGSRAATPQGGTPKPGTTTPSHRAPTGRTPIVQPPVTHTQDEPQITVGGS